jgi:hypothetical protein
VAQRKRLRSEMCQIGAFFFGNALVREFLGS